MNLTVTQQFIDKGRVASAFSCPVALCLREKIRDDYNILVGPSTLRIMKRDFTFIDFLKETVLGKNHTDFGVKLPEDARKFIEEFDSGDPDANKEPFDFELNIPKKLLK